MTTILTKKKDTAGAPAPGDLTNSAGGAELAVNTATKRLYTKDSGGTVVEIGTNPSTIDTTTVDTTNLEVTNIKAKDGTAGMQIADSTGVVSFTANPIVSGGTANGVAYLNGSNVLTTGSALTFDGTRLNVGNSDTTVLGVRGLTRGVRFDFDSTQATIYAVDNAYFNSYQPLRIGGSDTRFTISGIEQMRLTSTGLGIGTSAPAFVSGSGLEIERDSTNATLRLQRTGTNVSNLEIRA